MEKSFIQNDIIKEINNYDIIKNELEEKIVKVERDLHNPDICRTSLIVLAQYFDMKCKITIVANKQKKKLQRNLLNMESEHKYLTEDLKKYKLLKEYQIDLEKNCSFKMNTVNYIQTKCRLYFKYIKRQ